MEISRKDSIENSEIADQQLFHGLITWLAWWLSSWHTTPETFAMLWRCVAKLYQLPKLQFWSHSNETEPAVLCLIQKAVKNEEIRETAHH